MLVYLALIQYFIMLLPHSCRCVILVQITLLCICVTFYSFRCKCVFTVFIVYILHILCIPVCPLSVVFMGLAAWFKINDDDDKAAAASPPGEKLVSASIKKSERLILHPCPDPDQHEKSITSRGLPPSPMPTMFGWCPLPRSWVILLTDRMNDHVTPPAFAE